MGRDGRKEAYGSVACAEARDAVAGRLPLVLGHDGFQDVAHDVPELVVLVLEEEDQAGGLGVEGRGGVLDDVGDDLLDAGVGDRRGLVEGVDAATVGGSVEERHGGGHLGVCLACFGSG